MNKNTKIFLTIIIIIGIVLRLLPILNNNFPLTYDIGRDLLELKRITETGDLPLIGPTTGLRGLFYGPWWYYMLLPAFYVSSGNPKGVELFLVLIGLLTILIGFLLGKKIKNEARY